MTGRGPQWAREGMRFVWMPLLGLLGLVALTMIGLLFPTVTPEERSEVIWGLAKLCVMATLLIFVTLGLLADDFYVWWHSREAKRRAEAARRREERDRAERREVLETWRFNERTRRQQQRMREERARARRWAADGGGRGTGVGRKPKRFGIGGVLPNRPPPLRIAQPEL